MSRFRRILLFAFALLLAAFSPPRVGELVELEGAMNARSTARFRKLDQNKLAVFAKGTKVLIEEVLQLASGNYGLRVRGVHRPALNLGSVWIYFNVNNPSVQTQQSNFAPQDGQTGVTTRTVQGLQATALEASVRPTAGPAAWEVVTTVEQMNRAAQLQPNCSNCGRSSPQYERCDSSNSYLENQIEKFQDRNPLANILSITPKFPQFEACVRESMNMTGGRFALCQGTGAASTLTDRACTSEKLVRIVQNSFTLSIDCFADFMAGQRTNEAVHSDTFRQMTALINLESGFHVNAMSGTGAAGLGQITNGATDWVNRNVWNQMADHLQNSSNSSCEQIKMMNLQPIRPGRRNICERMSLEEGNPMVNMMYIVGHMTMVRQELSTVLDRKVRESGLRVRRNVREKILNSLSVWAHNTGAYGMSRPLASLLETTAGQRALESGNEAELMRLLKKDVEEFHRYYLARQNLSPHRIQKRAREASRFYSAVQEKMELLERKVGRSCSL